ncbi:hypothetical protein BJX99DRAFT_100771 [Aspergillus californicus]
MLERAFKLLSHSRTAVINFDEEDCSILELAIEVAFNYTRKITSTRRQFVQERTIPGSCGQVIVRKCKTCNMNVLDDAFPLFGKDMPERYVITVLSRGPGCGWPGCKGRPSLVPADPRLKYAPPTSAGFEKAKRTENSASQILTLLRVGSDLEDCPSVVTLRCPKIFRHTQDYSSPRWTIHKPARLLLPRPKCGSCDFNKAYFSAVDSQMKTITEPSLSSVLNGFKTIGCRLEQFPRIPEIIFAQTSYKNRFEMLKQAKERHTNPPSTASTN